MKKIPKSITVTVRNGDKFRAERSDGTVQFGDGMNIDRIRAAFPRTPTPPYKVTYREDPKGRYIVHIGARYSPACLMTHDDKEPADERGTFVCFLTPDFNGLRVSRRVEKVKK